MACKKRTMILVAALCSCTFLSLSQSADSLALTELYHALDGPVWKNSWSLDQPVSTWHGVVLNEQGQVMELHLSQNDLFSRNVADELSQLHLPALEILDLSNNNLNALCPDWDMPSLTTLNISNCDFTALAGFNGSPKLAQLNLANNYLSFRDLLPLLALNLSNFTYDRQRYAPTIFFNIGGICSGPVAARNDQAITAHLYFAEDNDLEGMQYLWRYGQITEMGGATLSLPQTVEGFYECVLSHPDLPDLQVRANKQELVIDENSNYIDLSLQLLASETGEKCWAIKTQNFDNILTLQYGISWDVNELKFSNIKEVNLEDFSGSYSVNNSTGQFILAWLTFSSFDTGLSLEQNSSLFTICFDPINEATITNASIQLGGNENILTEIYNSTGDCKNLSIGLNETILEEEVDKDVEETEEEEITEEEETMEETKEEETAKNEETNEEENTPTEEQPNSEIFEEYPWLTTLIDPTNCNDASVTVYSTETYQFLLVSTDGQETLYFQNGTFYCAQTPTYDCVAAYQLTEAPQYSWSCQDIDMTIEQEGDASDQEDSSPEQEEIPSESTTIFTDYSWLLSILDPSNCNGEEIRIYTNFVFIDTGKNGQLYRNDGVFYCNSAPNYNCEALYNLPAPTEIWTCPYGENSQDAPMEKNIHLSNSSSFNHGLKIFPNPNTGLFFVAGIPSTSTKISVYAVAGQLVTQFVSTTQLSSIQLDLQAFGSGLYYVHIYDQQEVMVRKVIVE